MNRTDRLYALVEELRAVAPRPRSARWLAGKFEVSSRTIERDLSSLQLSGVPIWAEPGRTGGYCLDPTHTLAPLNFTVDEALAVMIALGTLGTSPFHDAAASALRKVVAVTDERSLRDSGPGCPHPPPRGAQAERRTARAGRRAANRTCSADRLRRPARVRDLAGRGTHGLCR
ncbi:helix-turn-helix transcriptional regulator [Glaciihabitans tibetensis]|uniref:helix-turn-helix transcriptional regulator n=1 Tax=Glaciihabitans tibetensis TaxID=1266600 RepID=UPI001FE250A0|nr:HTH domain-containing protein [Glaciihabitans tibetensis]